MVAEFEPLIASPRLLAGTRADIQLSCRRDGQSATPTGSPTCTVVNAAGTTIATPTPTASAGLLTATLTAAQLANVDRLTVTWGNLVFDAEPAVSVVAEYEVIGAWLFTLAEAREFSPDTRPLANENKYTNARLLAERDRIHDDFEDILGFSCGLRYQREVLSGDGSASLWLANREVDSIRSIETRSVTTWTAFTSTELGYVIAGENGRLRRESGYWPSGAGNIRVSYVAGRQPIPSQLRRAALLVLQDQLTGSAVNRRATSESNEMGTFSLATPGLRGSYYGLPEVDELLSRLSRKLPGVA